jgi:hypothetical protein
MFRAFLLIVLGAFALPAWASVSDSEFQGSARIIPQTLLDQGYKSFGPLNLREFLRAIPSVAVAHVNQLAVLQPDGQSIRSFSAWSREGQRPVITFNDTFWSAVTPEMKNWVALNAYLSALGYDDHTYRLTFVLWFLTQKDPHEILKPAQWRGVLQEAKKAASLRPGALTGSGDLGGPLMMSIMIRQAVDKYHAYPGEEEREHLYSTVFWMMWNFNVESSWARKQ